MAAGEMRGGARRDKKSYDNMQGNGYAQVAISTTVRLAVSSKCLCAPDTCLQWNL